LSSPLVHYHRQSATGSGVNHSPLILGQNVTGVLTYYITKIRVYKVNPSNSLIKSTTAGISIGANIKSTGATLNSVLIGNGITTTSTSQKDVLIGSGIVGMDTSNATQSNVVIGADASIATDTSFGGSNNPDRVAIGARSKAACWRATALGGNAQALNTSATALGMGAVSEVSHGVALGRGAYIPSESGLVNSLVLESNDIYLSNGWGHRSDLPPSTIDILESVESVDPTTVESTIHGKDAFDARATPSETNIQGGPLSLAAGRSTGTAKGGSVKIKTSPAGGSSNNTKNTLITAAEFDAEVGVSTRFLLLDVTTGTLKRVSFGAADSGGTGFKVLRVEN
jgi:hypothetical protein